MEAGPGLPVLQGPPSDAAWPSRPLPAPLSCHDGCDCSATALAARAMSSSAGCAKDARRPLGAARSAAEEGCRAAGGVAERPAGLPGRAAAACSADSCDMTRATSVLPPPPAPSARPGGEPCAAPPPPPPWSAAFVCCEAMVPKVGASAPLPSRRLSVARPELGGSRAAAVTVACEVLVLGASRSCAAWACAKAEPGELVSAPPGLNGCISGTLVWPSQACGDCCGWWAGCWKGVGEEAVGVEGAVPPPACSAAAHSLSRSSAVSVGSATGWCVCCNCCCCCCCCCSCCCNCCNCCWCCCSCPAAVGAPPGASLAAALVAAGVTYAWATAAAAWASPRRRLPAAPAGAFVTLPPRMGRLASSSSPSASPGIGWISGEELAASQRGGEASRVSPPGAAVAASGCGERGARCPPAGDIGGEGGGVRPVCCSSCACAAASACGVGEMRPSGMAPIMTGGGALPFAGVRRPLPVGEPRALPVLELPRGPNMRLCGGSTAGGARLAEGPVVEATDAVGEGGGSSAGSGYNCCWLRSLPMRVKAGGCAVHEGGPPGWASWPLELAPGEALTPSPFAGTGAAAAASSRGEREWARLSLCASSRSSASCTAVLSWGVACANNGRGWARVHQGLQVGVVLPRPAVCESG